jgi:hypothetical protein
MGEVVIFAARAMRVALERGTRQAVEAVTDAIARDRPDLSAQACRTCAERFVQPYAGRTMLDPQPQRPRSKPVLEPGDPILKFYDDFKAAQAILQRAREPYDKAVRELARHHDLPVLNMSKIVQRAWELRRR